MLELFREYKSSTERGTISFYRTEYKQNECTVSNKELCKINTSWSHCTDLSYQSFFLHLSYNSRSKTGSAASPPLEAHCMVDLNPHFFQKCIPNLGELGWPVQVCCLFSCPNMSSSAGMKKKEWLAIFTSTPEELLVAVSNPQQQLLCGGLQ